MKRLLPLCLLLGGLLAPLLAHADAFRALAMVHLFTILLCGFVGLTALLVVLAFLRPASRILHVAQALFLLLFLGMACRSRGGLGAEVGTGWAAVFAAVVPLALLLRGVRGAQRARRPGAYRGWVSLAVVGSVNLLWQLLYELSLRPGWQHAASDYSVGLGNYLGLLLVVSSAAWALVLVILRRRQEAGWLWPPAWWRVPTLTTGLGVAYALLDFGRGLVAGEPRSPEGLPVWRGLTVAVASNMVGPPVLQLANALLLAMAAWVAGVALLPLLRPNPDEAAEATPAGE